MPVLLWLALLLGYFVGVAGALYLLPAPVVEPLVGRIMVASIVIMTGWAVFLVLQRRPLEEPAGIAPAGGMPFVGELDAAEGAPLPGEVAGGPRLDDIAGDAERLQAASGWSAAPGARAPDGSLGPRELRQILYEGRIRLLARPVVALPGREPAFLHGTPELLDRDGQVVPPRNYQRTLARCGLEPVLDRVQVVHALRAIEAGRRADGAVACTVATRSLASPVLLDGLDDVFRDGAGRGERLILEFDQLPRDPASRQAAQRLQRYGVRFALKRLSAAPLDLERMADFGITFVRLAAPRFAVLPDAAAHALPALGALIHAADDAGLTVVVDQAESEPAPMLDDGSLDVPLSPAPVDEARDDAA